MTKKVFLGNERLFHLLDYILYRLLINSLKIMNSQCVPHSEYVLFPYRQVENYVI